MAYGQPYWRFRDDLEALNTEASGWRAALNTDITQDAGALFRWRVEVEEDAGEGGSTTFKAQYQYKESGGGYGAWGDVPDRDDASIDGPIMALGSNYYADGDATTDLLSGSSETFEAGEGCENRVTNSNQTVSNEHTEHEFCLMFSGVWEGPNRISDGGAVQLRVVEGDGTVFGGAYVTPEITINVPDYYIGAITPETPGNVGPFCDANGNLYVFCEPSPLSSGFDLEVLKSSDGGKSWAFQDTANAPTAGDIEAVDCYQDGDILHVAVQDGGDDVTYHTFQTSDHASADAWGTTDEAVVTPSNAPADQGTGITVRSDDSLVIFYRYSDGSNERVGYKIKNGGWGSEVNLDTTAATDFVFSGCVLGESDKTHVFYRDATNNDIYHKSINSSDTLSDRELVEDDGQTAHADHWGTAPPVYWDDAGDEIIMVLVQDDSDQYLYSVVITDDGAPEARKQVSEAAIWEDRAGHRQPVAHLAVDTSTDTCYALFSYDSDEDVYLDSAINDGGWGTDSSHKASVTVDYLVGQIYTHSAGNGGDTVFGYWYRNEITGLSDTNGDNGFSWYGEYVIAEGTSALSIAVTPTDDSYQVQQIRVTG